MVRNQGAALATRDVPLWALTCAVGMSTSFLVIQAQRDLAVARDNEQRSYLEYQLSVVNFEKVQRTVPSISAVAAAVAR